MTDDQLNALAAEKVMGFPVVSDRNATVPVDGPVVFSFSDPPSTAAYNEESRRFDPIHSIADAMRLVEKIANDEEFDAYVTIEVMHQATVVRVEPAGVPVSIFEEEGKSAPRVITLACLKAVGAIE